MPDCGPALAETSQRPESLRPLLADAVRVIPDVADVTRNPGTGGVSPADFEVMLFLQGCGEVAGVVLGEQGLT